MAVAGAIFTVHEFCRIAFCLVSTFLVLFLRSDKRLCGPINIPNRRQTTQNEQIPMLWWRSLIMICYDRDTILVEFCPFDLWYYFRSITVHFYHSPLYIILDRFWFLVQRIEPSDWINNLVTSQHAYELPINRKVSIVWVQHNHLHSWLD